MEIRTVCFAAVLLTCVKVLQCASIDKRGYELQKANSRRVKEFTCGVPQQRVIPLSEIFKEKFNTDQTIAPHVTVLHRCENAGCCNGTGFTCSPASVEQVELGFMIIPSSGVASLRVVQATNHTSCSCQPPEMPK